jgi:hypothetical protein
MDFPSRALHALHCLRTDCRGGLPMQVALALCAVGVLGALFAAPMLESAVSRRTAPGYDDTLTGTVARRTQRYVIRQSVLSDTPQVICTSGGKIGCRD